MNGEKGQALPLAVMALAIGMLVITPFLGHASASIIGSRTYSETIANRNAADAGIEHAIWNLIYNDFGALFSEPGDQINYQLDETLNGLMTDVIVTANATGSIAGEIEDAIIDSLEYNTSAGYEPSIIHVSGDVYAIAHRGANNDGFLKTVTIDSDGQIGNSAIDTLEFDTSNGHTPGIIHVSGDVYAIVYRGSSGDGFLKTASITANGDIGNSTLDTLEFDTSKGYEPTIVRVFGDVFAIAYRGQGNDGFVKTVSIAADGNIGDSVIDSLEFDTSAGYTPRIVKIGSTIFTIAYRGPGNDGFVTTISIAADGDISNSTIDSLEFDTSAGYEPDLVNVWGDIYVIAYRNTSNSGILKTVSIDGSGNIGDSVIDTFQFDTTAYTPRILNVFGQTFAIAYRGSGNDGYLKTVTISAAGDIGSPVIDTMEFDTSKGYEPVITHMNGDIYAITYRGPGNDGYVITVEISSNPSLATWEILSAAGNATIRAYVSTDNQTASILIWRIES